MLGPLGIEVGWKEARLKAQFDGAIADGVLSAHVRGLAFTDGKQRHASVEEIALEGWKLAAGLRELGTLRVHGVACELGRDEKGAMLAFGMRVGPRPEAAPAAAPATTPATKAAPAEAKLPKLPALGCSGIDIEGVRLHWMDRCCRSGSGCTPTRCSKSSRSRASWRSRPSASRWTASSRRAASRRRSRATCRRGSSCVRRATSSPRMR